MENLNLGESEFRFACIIWENEPIASGELVRQCQTKLGWKKSTTYTVLKKLCARNIFKNENAIVSSIVKKEAVQKYESEQFIDKTFEGSLPKFIASFMSDKKMSDTELKALQKLIDGFKGA